MIVSWHNLPTVPRNYKLMLTDTLTNQTVDMRNESSYEFTSAAANSTRSFTLSATPTNGRAIVVVSNISVNPGRTGGRAAGTSEIQYTVSADSNVDVSVLGSNGRVIALVSPTRAVTSGLNSVVWTGQDVNGHTVPGGTYILQIRATDSGGNMTRQIVPLIVTGR
jgi:flagellar hook assembly protein FlgD